MSAKGLLQAIFWCGLCIIFLFSWWVFTESQVSEKVLHDYYRLPENCHGKYGNYRCSSSVDTLNATDSEKFWLKMENQIFIPLIFFFIFILFILWITKQKNIPKIDLSNNWNNLGREAELLRETELYINSKNSLEKDNFQNTLDPVIYIKNEEDVKFDWNEKPFEYQQNNIL